MSDNVVSIAPKKKAVRPLDPRLIEADVEARELMQRTEGLIGYVYIVYIESRVLGALLLDMNKYAERQHGLTVDAFHLPANRLIFSAILRLQQAGSTVDLITVSDALTKSKELEAAGGVQYLASVTERIPRVAPFEQWVALLRRNQARMSA